MTRETGKCCAGAEAIKLIEQRSDRLSGDRWTERWFCEPPALSVKYQVVRDYWDPALKVRDIYEWKGLVE